MYKYQSLMFMHVTTKRNCNRNAFICETKKILVKFDVIVGHVFTCSRNLFELICCQKISHNKHKVALFSLTSLWKDRLQRIYPPAIQISLNNYNHLLRDRHIETMFATSTMLKMLSLTILLMLTIPSINAQNCSPRYYETIRRGKSSVFIYSVK